MNSGGFLPGISPAFTFALNMNWVGIAMAHDYMDLARKAIEDENFEEVERLATKGEIPQSQLDLLINNVFIIQCNRKNYAKAVKLGKSFHLPQDRIREAAQRYFSELIFDGKFDQALEWGKSNELPGTDIEEAAVKYCRSSLSKGYIGKALEIKRDYSLKADSLGQSAEDAFNNAFQAGNYDLALRLAEEFALSQNKLWTIIRRVMEQYIDEKSWAKLLNLLNTHHILEERVFEEFRVHDQTMITDLLANKVIKENLRAEEYDFIIMFVEKSGILNRIPRNPQLAKLHRFVFLCIAEIHKTYFLKENIVGAISLSEKFRLLDASVPAEVRESIKAIARKYHDDLLRKGEFERAIRIKKNYNLLDADVFIDYIYALDDAVIIFLENALFKAETEQALEAVKEYRISRDQVQHILKKVIRECMEKKSFPRIFEILKKFSLPSDDSELISTAENHFNNAMQENQFELAAQIAFYFKMKRELGIKAGYRAWEKSMQYGNIGEAIILKKRHRLPAEMTANAAKETYQRFLRVDPDMARRIRDEYQINLSFLELLLEFLRKLMNILLSQKK